MKLHSKSLIATLASTALLVAGSANANVVAQYSFENNLNDTAASGSVVDNLTYVKGGSASASAQYVAGVVGQAAVFDGGNWFRAADSADNDLIGNTWTIEAFVKRDGAAPSIDRLILKWDNPYSYHLSLASGDLDLYAPGVSHVIDNANTTPTATDFGDGDWHHIAVSSDGTNTKAYIDGSVVYTGAAITLVDTTAGLGLGNSANSDFPANRFNGWMDEVLLHNAGVDQNYINSRVALIPEPTSLALLGLGGLLVARRRRG